MARSFNSVNDRVVNASLTSFPLVSAGHSGTLAFRFKPNWNSGSGVWYQIFQFQNTPSGANFEMLRFSDNNLYTGFTDDGAGRLTISDAGLFTAGTWVTFVITYTVGGNTTFYQNTTSLGTKAKSATTGSYSSGTVGNQTGGGQGTNGSMADFAFWSDIVLTAGEIASFNTGARPHTIRPTKLIINWPIDGLSSPEPDLSGLKQNGTVTGTALAAGPPVMMFTPRCPQFTTLAAAAGAVKFRRTLSSVGTRAGSRQVQAP